LDFYLFIVFFVVFQFLLRYGVVFLADGSYVATRTVPWGFAPADDGTELIAFRGAGNVMRGHHWDDVMLALDILCSDLESIEIEASTTGLEPGVAEGIEDLGEGNQDGAAIFEDGELEGFVRRRGRLGGEGVQAGVEVAIVFAAEGKRGALVSAGQDVTTFRQHSSFLLPPPLSGRRFFVFNMMQRGLRRKYFILQELFAKIRRQRSYRQFFSSSAPLALAVRAILE
jgi:hypothetical protein